MSNTSPSFFLSSSSFSLSSPNLSSFPPSAPLLCQYSDDIGGRSTRSPTRNSLRPLLLWKISRQGLYLHQHHLLQCIPCEDHMICHVSLTESCDLPQYELETFTEGRQTAWDHEPYNGIMRNITYCMFAFTDHALPCQVAKYDVEFTCPRTNWCSNNFKNICHFSENAYKPADSILTEVPVFFAGLTHVLFAFYCRCTVQSVSLYQNCQQTTLHFFLS